MAEKILKKQNLTEFVTSLAQSRRVMAPVNEGGKVKLAPVTDGEFVTDYQNMFLSPKQLFFPQSEKMLECTFDSESKDANILKEPDSKPEPRLVFGIRPCDAKAFAVLDTIFTNDQFCDPYWVDKREATVLVGLGCNQPCPTCFCTSMNCGPFSETGLDAIAYDLGDEYLIKVLTEKGEEALAQTKGLEEVGGGEADKAAQLKAGAEQSINANLHMDNINQRSVLELFNAEHWDRVFESCLNCGTCTFSCPTCHCFDIQDETCGQDGDRVRNWDSCMSWLFTFHGSGHNPRPGKKERVRQRFMHKIKYIPMKRDGEIGCVGCGRCVSLCPVNIDIRDVIRDMNA